MRTLLIGLCGPKGVGKSTYARSLGGVTLSFATPIKEMLKVILPHPIWLDKKEEPIPGFPNEINARKLLQTLGTEWGRESIYPNIWVDAAKRMAEPYLGKRLVVFDDIRFPNEAWAIKRWADLYRISYKIIHISREGHEVDPNDSHISEHGLPEHFITEWVTVDEKSEAPPTYEKFSGKNQIALDEDGRKYRTHIPRSEPVRRTKKGRLLPDQELPKDQRDYLDAE